MTAPAISEAQFQEWLIGEYSMRAGRYVGGLAGAHRWLVMHPERSTISGYGNRQVHKTGAAKGYPDITLARYGQVAFVELKSQTGRLAPAQAEWLTELAGDTPEDEWHAKGDTPSGFAIGLGYRLALATTPLPTVRRAQTIVMVARPAHRGWLESVLAR